MNRPSVAIVLLNWNSFNYTNDCLVSLDQINYDNVEIVVVDNASSDDSLKELELTHPNVTYIKNGENLGFTGGNNVGIEYALEKDNEYVLLLNNDTLVDPDFLSELVDSIHQDPMVAAVQPKIYYNHDRSLIWHAGGKYFPALTYSQSLGNNKEDSLEFNTEKHVDWITCCALLVKTEVIKEVGMLSDLFFYGCYDDVELSLRIRKAGYNLKYCPKSIIYHAVLAAARGDDKNKEGVIKPYFHYLVNRNHLILLRLQKNYFYKLSGFIFQLLKIVSYVVYFAVRMRPRKFKACIHGFYHGISKPLNPELLNHKHYIDLYK
ncbi:glycosyltransferase family 2 protein [Roseivirga sp.]|uniref:glycosyltransferase family 2 protein n=1 Tax=Roseivirga sp. TaxID=1964215 RepID=UPI003B8C5768